MAESEQPLQPQPKTHRYQIGYALQPNKIQNALGTTLFDYAKQRAIDLIQIDLTKPLTQQGPFHCIIHKLQPNDWEQLHLEDFIMAQTPRGSVSIVDPPELVERLKNRVSMLDAVAKLRITVEHVTVGVPTQILVDQALNETDLVNGNCLTKKDSPNCDKYKNAISNGCGTHHKVSLEGKVTFPVIAKPFHVDGTASSHELRLVFDEEGLATTLEGNKDNPVVLQEFVNHGGVVFKVYVAGEHVTCVKRKSLPDISEEKAKTLKGAVNFSYISYFSTQENKNNDDDDDNDAKLRKMIEKTEMPPESFVKELGKGLREAMGINMFNFDVIRDAKDRNRYLVIDINYFPGYAKLPCYEPFFTDFLLDLVRDRRTAD